MSRLRNWLNNELYPRIIPQVEEMRTVWSEMGESLEDQENEILETMQEVEQISQRIMERKLRRLHIRHEQLIVQCEACAKRINELNMLLSIEYIEPDANLKLIQLENWLRDRVQELEGIRVDRASRLKELCDREQFAAALLGERPLVISEDLLTEDILQNVLDRCEFLDDEKARRQQKFYTTRENILLLMDELDRKPETSFEKDLVFESGLAFQLTDVNMNGLENLALKLNEDLTRNRAEANRCLGILRMLWDFLEIDSEYRDSFLDRHSGHRPSVIRALKDEIHRCRRLKQEKAPQYLEKVRAEIASMWDQCYYGSQQRKAFKAYYVEEANEELLEAHDNELQRLQDVFAAGKPVYDVFQKRVEIWEKLLQFEKPTDDPQRLNNRGGRLLREERERKKLMILFPKLEAELARMTNEWEAEHKHRFLVFGVPVMDFIRDQWDAHRQEKENEKLERIRAKAKKIEDELVNGSKANVSRKRVNCTPKKENPRKVVKVTPQCAGSVFHSASRTPLGSRPPPSSVKGTVRKTRVLPRRLAAQHSRVALERTMRTSPMDTLLANANNNSQLTSTMLGTSHLSTFSEFTKNINRRCRINHNTRSSAVTPQPSPGTPRRHLRDRLGLPFLL